MNKSAKLGAVGVAIAAAAGLWSVPANAQLESVTKAASQLADKLMGTSSATPSPTIPTNIAVEKSARITLLDKQTNRRQTLTLLAGQSQTAGFIEIKLNRCLPDYAATLGQDVAWLDISDSSRSTPWFSGWMFNTYPEISTLDHPRYDVILQGCGIKERKVVRNSGSAPVIESSGPVVDTESSDPVDATLPDAAGAEPAAPVPAGTDPFYVPGVEKTPSPEPVQQPAAPSAQPAAPAAEKPAEQQDLHQMMDGQY